MLVKLVWSEEIHLTIGKIKKEKKLICKFHCFICYIKLCNFLTFSRKD